MSQTYMHSASPTSNAEKRERHQSHRSEPVAAISHILRVPVAFFFEGAANASAPHGFHGGALSILITSSPFKRLKADRAFMRIDNADLRRRIVMLVQEIAGDDGD
jgi:hypothetical protein